MDARFEHPLRLYRAAKKMTQGDLAAAIGVEAMTVSRWENGTAFPRGRHWKRIKTVTGVTPEQLAAFKASGAESVA